ncbi:MULTISPECIES: tetratricopeptide repeat protein [unclassified Pseudomonas]|uniref:tetratricopeptide repeat protein n=1 Tax=unclassified Pseudomonas TaxID=196821 RepID=UPI00215BE59F|nr:MULTISPECIES: tetratricopeptide repeat protein [unclassified Pseudomonas]MCR8933148.1 sel1 repeat family protein [Pseudomonas sp. S11A4]MCR8976752.1 sel1 repeat family protein [Pseudomonas sp. S11P7]
MSFQLRREEVLDAAGLTAMLEESPARAAQAILLAAGEGEVEAQALLGQILLDGRGIAQDQPLALRWFGIAAERGHLMARNMLGRCHEHGWGCVADALVAAQHYRIAAEAGLDWAMYNLANLLATGRGVAVDHLQALALYSRAAELGHAKSMNLLGRYLEEGQVCPADLTAARDWYRRSAEGGDFRGQFSYAAVLAAEGRIDETLVWLEKALVGGNLNFLRVASQTLADAADPRVQAMAARYSARYTELQRG